MMTDSTLSLLPKERQVIQMQPLPAIKGSGAWTYRYLCYQEVSGQRATRGEVNQLLAQIDLETVIHLVALINSTCTETVLSSYIGHPYLQGKLETLLFSHEWRQRICRTRWGDTPLDCAIFHRQQQLMLLFLALENSPQRKDSPQNEGAQHNFGLAALMVNDLLSSRPLTEDEIIPQKGHLRRSREVLTDAQKWDIRANTLPTLDFHLDSNARNYIGRAQKLWIDSQNDTDLQQRAGKDWVDWAGFFEEKYNISIQDFLNITAALWMYTSQAVPSDADSQRFLIFEPHHVLRETKLPRSTIATALQMLSRSVADLQSELPMMPRQRLGWDLTALQSTPLITLEDGRVVVYDQILLLKAATEGIYWLIQEALPNVKVFGNMFGHVYDHYIGQLLRRIVPAHEPPALPRYHPNPFFAKATSGSKKGASSKNDEVSDGLINCEPQIALIEVKGSLLSTRAKYSGDRDALKQEVNSKFALETGAKQLASTIKRLAQGDKPNIRGYNSQAQRRVFPILVSYDTATATPLICQYINEVFKEQLGRLPSSSRLRVGKIIVLSTYEVEALEAVCRTESLFKLLMRYEKTCAADVPFRFFLQGNYGELLNGTDVLVADAFHYTAQSIQQMLFGISRELLPEDRNSDSLQADQQNDSTDVSTS